MNIRKNDIVYPFATNPDTGWRVTGVPRRADDVFLLTHTSGKVCLRSRKHFHDEEQHAAQAKWGLPTPIYFEASGDLRLDLRPGHKIKIGRYIDGDGILLPDEEGQVLIVTRYFEVRFYRPDHNVWLQPLDLPEEGDDGFLYITMDLSVLDHPEWLENTTVHNGVVHTTARDVHKYIMLTQPTSDGWVVPMFQRGEVA